MQEGLARSGRSRADFTVRTSTWCRGSTPGRWRATGRMADLVTDEMLDLFAVIGRFEEIGAKIRQRYRGLYCSGRSPEGA